MKVYAIVADQCPQHVFFPFRVFLLPVPTVWFMKVYAIRGRWLITTTRTTKYLAQVHTVGTAKTKQIEALPRAMKPTISL
jgi:hypothetical protein